MDDLVQRFEPVNIAMAMACDGVRRGEMNIIRKSKGFSWGPGAMSNAYWKGARLADVLKAAGISRDNVQADKRLYVHFEGADSPSEGPYATSVAYDHVIDPMNDVILAYEMVGLLAAALRNANSVVRTTRNSHRTTAFQFGS